MRAEPEADLRRAGLVRLADQSHLLSGAALTGLDKKHAQKERKKAKEKRLRHYEWLEGLGVRLRQCGDCPCGQVWGPRWLDVLETCFKSGNVLGVGVSRALRDPEWAEAVQSAFALGGPKGVAALVRQEDAG